MRIFGFIYLFLFCNVVLGNIVEEQVCRNQLSIDVVPTACFDLSGTGFSEDELNVKCALAAENIVDIHYIQRLLKYKALSLKCRTQLENRKSIIQYQNNG